MKDLLGDLTKQFADRFRYLPELELPYVWQFHTTNETKNGIVTLTMTAKPEITWTGEDE